MDCSGDPRFNPSSIIHVSTVPIQTRYFHNLSTAQIEQMRHLKLHNKSLHNPGVTVAEHELTINYELGGLEHARGDGFCVWAESVSIGFSYNQMDVYITSQYPAGSCPYTAILNHENQHVAINTRTLEKYRVLMTRALKSAKTIPTRAHPLNVLSEKNGGDIISARISRIVNPLLAKFKNEIQRENGKIDTMENYRRVQAQCRDW